MSWNYGQSVWKQDTCQDVTKGQSSSIGAQMQAAGGTISTGTRDRLVIWNYLNFSDNEYMLWHNTGYPF